MHHQDGAAAKQANARGPRSGLCCGGCGMLPSTMDQHRFSPFRMPPTPVMFRSLAVVLTLIKTLRFASLCLLLMLCLLGAPAQVKAGNAPLRNDGRLICNEAGLIAAEQPSKVAKHQTPRELQVGEMLSIPSVCPAEHYFPTGILITAGGEYLINAQGRWQDAWITAGPSGWPGFVLQAWNRIPWQRFFMLGGAVGKSESHLFPIGVMTKWQAPNDIDVASDRELFLFANDWPRKYGNNREAPGSKGGPLRVSVKRLR